MSILLRNYRCLNPKVIQKVNISTTGTKNALPPILFAFIKPASRVLAMILGRRARKWWKKLPESEKERFRGQRINNGRILGCKYTVQDKTSVCKKSILQFQVYFCLLVLDLDTNRIWKSVL